MHPSKTCFDPLSGEEVGHITRHLRGIREARVNFLGQNDELEGALDNLLQALSPPGAGSARSVTRCGQGFCPSRSQISASRQKPSAWLSWDRWKWMMARRPQSAGCISATVRSAPV